MEVKTNNFTCIYAGVFFRISDEQSGKFWIQDSFCLYTKMGESEIKMCRFGCVSGAFKPNKVLGSKNPCESEYLNFANGSRKKTPVNVAVVGKQTLKAICNLCPPQRFNETLLDYPNI